MEQPLTPPCWGCCKGCSAAAGERQRPQHQRGLVQEAPNPSAAGSGHRQTCTSRSPTTRLFAGVFWRPLPSTLQRRSPIHPDVFYTRSARHQTPLNNEGAGEDPRDCATDLERGERIKATSCAARTRSSMVDPCDVTSIILARHPITAPILSN